MFSEKSALKEEDICLSKGNLHKCVVVVSDFPSSPSKAMGTSPNLLDSFSAGTQAINNRQESHEQKEVHSSTLAGCHLKSSPVALGRYLGMSCLD